MVEDCFSESYNHAQDQGQKQMAARRLANVVPTSRDEEAFLRQFL